ncbi:uncharacterized protein LOC122650493 [Telopea speciosissima]|uniref:uncharacterized protein LOC122650493 n=1 Tax=Telopea speciosissima TaxID=54955 RepID=UPI001CC33D8F|nr:uncharacterized protein LOC122650493 [Telopea speciosissima]
MRRQLWEDLVTFAGLNCPWLVVGDFNTYLFADDKRGPGRFNLGSAEGFTTMVDTASLMPIPSMGNKFTWTNNRRVGNVQAVLDLVRSSWLTPISGSPLYIVNQKLKRLKGPLRDWAKGVFPHIEHEVLRTKNCLENVQGRKDMEGFSEELFKSKLQARIEHDKAIELHEKLWREKARNKWLALGDRCTKYFHASTKTRHVRSFIREIIKEDGSVLADVSEIGNHIVAHFENFFKRGTNAREPAMLSVIPKIISDVEKDMLTKIPTQEEIKAAVFDLDPNSALGPDGYPGTFFRVCWDFIGRDVCRGVQNFFKEGVITKGVNCNFMCLIPKVDGANRVGQFRPLCLGNFFFKIIPKIMAIRLSTILHMLISPEQGAFQKGKVIFENIGVASELTNMMEIKCRGGGLGMKLDIQKAFDTLEWSFLFDVMGAFGFDQRWIHWVHQILQSTRISILINGGPGGFFGMERGLRQGDPLSPLLFILAEEILCRGLKAIRERGWLKALNGPRQVFTPSHLLYVDDLFIFMKAEMASVRWVKQFLEAYGRYSGQVVNLAKSKVFMGRISSARKQQLQSVLQIPVCTFPTKYLGVMLKKGRVQRDLILPLMDQFKKRLAAWKGRFLSMAGRIELVRSVMSSIPVHNFSVYLWLASAIENMERWIRNFIWLREADHSKAITVSWDTLCKPKGEGGLGIRRLRDLNLALIAKLVWTIKSDSSDFARFLRGRFVRKDGSFKKPAGTSMLLPVSLLFNEMWGGFPSMEVLFSWWKRKAKTVPLPVAWNVLLIIVPQQIWMERNRRCFDGHRRNPSQVTKICFAEVMNYTRMRRVQVKSINDLVIARQLKCVISKPMERKIIECMFHLRHLCVYFSPSFVRVIQSPPSFSAPSTMILGTIIDDDADDVDDDDEHFIFLSLHPFRPVLTMVVTIVTFCLTLFPPPPLKLPVLWSIMAFTNSRQNKEGFSVFFVYVFASVTISGAGGTTVIIGFVAPAAVQSSTTLSCHQTKLHSSIQQIIADLFESRL